MPEQIDEVSGTDQTDQEDIEEFRAQKYCEHSMTYRAKWLLDGCSTILQMAERLRAEIRYLEDLHEKGWTMQGEMHDDYSNLTPPNIDQLVEEDVLRYLSARENTTNAQPSNLTSHEVQRA